MPFKILSPTTFMTPNYGRGVEPVVYYLYDTFTNQLASSLISGSASEPGNFSIIGTVPLRSVVDTNGIMMVTGSQLATSGTPANGDNFMYPNLSITRAFGVTLIIDMPSLAATGAQNNRLGFVRAGNVVAHAFSPFASNNLTVYYNNTAGPTFILGAAPWKMAIVLRTSGAYYFYKTTANWVLMYHVAVDNTATLFVRHGLAATLTKYSLDNIRVIPSGLLPVPALYSTFTGNDSVSVVPASDIVGPDAQVTTAITGVAQAGTWGITSNKLYCPTLAAGIGIFTFNTGKADVMHDIAVNRAAGVVGAVLRYTDINNYLISYHDGTNVKLDKVVAGVTTNLLSGVKAYSAGAVLRTVVDGTSAQVYYSDTQIGGGSATVPASASTLHGAYTTDNTTGSNIDNMTTLAHGNTGTDYAVLDLM